MKNKSGTGCLGLIVIVVALFLLWAVASIVEEIAYPKYCNYKEYTLELHLLNKEVVTKTYKLPDNITIQVNCHSHKGTFNGCDLEYVNDGMYLSSGHWKSIKQGVNDFKILKIK